MATYWEIAAHSAYEMFSWYKYLIVSLVFSHLGFWSGSLFLIAPFPDLCLLVLFSNYSSSTYIPKLLRIPQPLNFKGDVNILKTNTK